MKNKLSKLALAVLLSLSAVSANADYTFSLLDTLGGTVSEAKGINASGQVVGYSATAGNANDVATLWNGSIASALSTPGWANAVATGINNQGQITGYSISGSSTPNSGDPFTNSFNALLWSSFNNVSN